MGDRIFSHCTLPLKHLFTVVVKIEEKGGTELLGENEKKGLEGET